jgi:DNA invertase Pin-like site-specific DNA recombinase
LRSCNPQTEEAALDRSGKFSQLARQCGLTMILAGGFAEFAREQIRKGIHAGLALARREVVAWVD